LTRRPIEPDSLDPDLLEVAFEPESPAAGSLDAPQCLGGETTS